MKIIVHSTNGSKEFRFASDVTVGDAATFAASHFGLRGTYSFCEHGPEHRGALVYPAKSTIGMLPANEVDLCEDWD